MREDQNYVIEIAEEILGEAAKREYCFDWLRGDPNAAGARKALPVDAYFPEHALVLEYHEKQHRERVGLFDDKQTISGVSRGEQRRRYDALRSVEVPRHGLRLVVVSDTDLVRCAKGHVIRQRTQDAETIRRRLGEAGVI